MRLAVLLRPYSDVGIHDSSIDYWGTLFDVGNTCLEAVPVRWVYDSLSVLEPLI